jgi:hypothetical protein
MNGKTVKQAFRQKRLFTGRGHRGMRREAKKSIFASNAYGNNTVPLTVTIMR